MDINLTVSQAHKTAKEKGWWDHTRTPLEIHMLVVTELAEASEAVRMGNEEEERIELADAVIRIMDYFGHRGWNLDKTISDKMVQNLARSYRHGGKAI